MKFVFDKGAFWPADPEAAAFIAGDPQGVEVEIKPLSNSRTSQQNRAMWKYCTLLAESLNAAGFDQRTFPFKDGLTIPFSKDAVMTLFWRPIQKAMLGDESTRNLSTKEVNQVYEAVDRAISERTGVHVEFPCEESRRAA